MKLMIVGDTHGNIKDIQNKLITAGTNGIQHVLVVGDFGLWTHNFDGQFFLDGVNILAESYNLTVFAIGGNHENWDHWNWYVENNPKSKGFVYVRSRILLAPKAHRWTWAGKQFFGAGGAVSIDKESRLKMERGYRNDFTGQRQGGTGEKTLWWPNEELEESDVDLIKRWGHCDYLLTHDCSNYTPWNQTIKPDMDSQIHRQKIDEVLKSTEPSMHFHGHMHAKYDWVNEYSGRGARTIGLEAFQDPNSYGVLDVENGLWYWPDEFAQAQSERLKAKQNHDLARGGTMHIRRLAS